MAAIHCGEEMDRRTYDGPVGRQSSVFATGRHQTVTERANVKPTEAPRSIYSAGTAGTEGLPTRASNDQRASMSARISLSTRREERDDPSMGDDSHAILEAQFHRELDKFELLPKQHRGEPKLLTLAAFDVPKVHKGQDLFGVAPLPVETPSDLPTPDHVRQNRQNQGALRWVTEGQGDGVLFDGCSYIGQWSRSLPNGTGTSQHPDGTQYTGTWVNGKRAGAGTMKLKGMVYEGQMHANYFHGRGRCAFANGDVFEGQYYMNKFEGHGTYTFANGEVFVGSFHFDQFHGKGRYDWPDGRSYEGGYCRDMKSGRGILVGSNGRIYEGEFVDGKKHGKGKESTNEWTYEGRYEYDRKSGQGLQKWGDGRKYDGSWKDGKMSGHGKMTTPTFTYVGEYKFGKMHGRGKLQSPSRTEEGLFQADIFVGQVS